ncbi:hypothetical protein D3C72_1121040 [compost metagenome]
MLGLAQQVHRAQFAVHAVVRDHQRFGGAGEQVDTHAPVQLALGFGHEHIARPDQHVHGRHAGRAHRHGHHGLHATEHQDFVGAGHVHGGHDGRMRLALIRRRGGHNALHARHLGGQHAHVRRGQERIFSAGDVAAHGVHRHVLVAQHHAGIRFHFHVAHGITLDLGKVAHLGLGERNVLDFPRRQLLAGGFDFRARQAEVGRVPVVELAAVVAHGVVAACLDVADDGFDGGAYLGVIVGFYGGGTAALQIANHGFLALQS